MKIDFDEDKHEYSVGGIRIPSVSEILAPLSAERYGELNPWMLKAAAAKGTAVHEACELIDYGGYPVQKLMTPTAQTTTEIVMEFNSKGKKRIRVLQ